jgi:hypothetical protein
VIEKISQTWLASQTGPTVTAMASWSASWFPASRSRIPAPKSAPVPERVHWLATTHRSRLQKVIGYYAESEVIFAASLPALVCYDQA